jgi:hypothetical protein
MAKAHLIDHPTEHLHRGLATAVEGALWRFAPIRQSLTLLDVQAAGDGTVRLGGNIRSDAMKAIAARIARGVPGVLAVEDRLVSDSALESDLALAIANDPEAGLYTDPLTISAILGMVYLGGIIAREDLAEAERLRDRIVEVARATPGVTEIVDNVQAVQGTGTTYAVEEAAAPTDEPTAAGARAMGSLIPEERREKIRAMIRARAASAG